MNTLTAILITILHEVCHCLTCELPKCDDTYKKFSNPFVRTYKKNIGLYKVIFEENNNEILEENKFNIIKEKTIEYDTDDDNEFIKKHVDNYNYIEDSGEFFEKELMNDLSTIDYIKSEYLLNINNYNQSLEDFKNGYENFKNLFKTKNMNETIEANSFQFKKSSENNYIRGICALSGK